MYVCFQAIKKSHTKQQECKVASNLTEIIYANQYELNFASNPSWIGKCLFAIT